MAPHLPPFSAQGPRLRAWALSRARTPLMLLAALSLSACVSESPALPRGVPYARQGPFGTINGPGLPSSGNANSTSHVRLAVKPLGTLPYDGQTLPLLDPLGRFAATQQGDTIPWPTLLAELADPQPYSTTISIYSLDPSVSLTLAAIPELPPGTILGRSADALGFLVERPMDDGSRWIGKVAWKDGAITWLVADEHLNAHATLGPRGELAWSRLRVGSSLREIVIRPSSASRAGEKRFTIAGESCIEPTFGACAHRASSDLSEPIADEQPRSLWAFVVPREQTVSSTRAEPRLALVEIVFNAAPDDAPVAAQRVSIALPATFAEAYQCIASVQTPARTVQLTPAEDSVATSADKSKSRDAQRTAPLPIADHEGLIYVDAAQSAAVWIPSMRLTAGDSTSMQSRAHSAHASSASSQSASRSAPIAARSVGALVVQSSIDTSAAFIAAEPDALCYRGLGAPSKSGQGNRLELLQGVFLPFSAGTHPGEMLLLAPPAQGEDSVIKILRTAPIYPGSPPGLAP